MMSSNKGLAESLFSALKSETGVADDLKDCCWNCQQKFIPVWRVSDCPSPLNYHFFPKSCCRSVNEVICHGCNLLLTIVSFNHLISIFKAVIHFRDVEVINRHATMSGLAVVCHFITLQFKYMLLGCPINSSEVEIDLNLLWVEIELNLDVLAEPIENQAEPIQFS
ncbi:hypothetical protein ZIOFF_017216 [Zingiber officinale]|uniref:Uncharacterized protein n=1 Tax=Zingiber officinale TaxID=94328 RepID=A0A8J5HEG1_ZINOF|nr:hypothetical protein ZIOFF_017216 [Zingiber officinale]